MHAHRWPRVDRKSFDEVDLYDPIGFWKREASCLVHDLIAQSARESSP
jgi:hypothetical protein